MNDPEHAPDQSALSDGLEDVFTHCRICASFCGLKVTVDRPNNRIARIAPDKENPYTWRDFCPKGRTANEVVEHPKRLTVPMRRVGDHYEESTWEEAIDDISTRLRRLIERDGPNAIGSYHGNPAGQLLSTTMFFTGLLDAIGTTNRFWVGSIDQNNVHVVSEKLYGSPLVSLICDVDECDCFLLIGTNPAVSGMHWVENVSDGWRRILRRKADGADLIVVDPRRTESAEEATLHVAPQPGTDWALLLGLLHVIFRDDLTAATTEPPLKGVQALRELAADQSLESLADRCGVDAKVIELVAHRFATARTALCVARTGVSQSLTGTITEWLSLVLNHVTGRVDVPGGRRFEKGYVDAIRLWSLFAPPLTDRTRVRGLPAVAGFHSLAELPAEITTSGPGQIKAMLVACGNPVVTGPAGAELDAALAELELLVVFDLVQRESHRHAHWLLPGTHWLERGELHALLSSIHDQPFVQYGAQAVDAPAGCREEWSTFVDLALALKRPLFGKRGVNTFIRASRWIAQLSRRPGLAFSPTWVERLLVISGRRLRWKDILARPHGWIYDTKEYGNLAAVIRTPDKAVRVDDPELMGALREALARSFACPDPAFPFQLISRRDRESMNSWLNEVPGLHKRKRSNELELNCDDADRLGIAAGDLVRVSSPGDSLVVPAAVTSAVRPGVVVIAQGWGSMIGDPLVGGEPITYGVNRNRLVGNVEIDPLSQAPALNGTWVALERT